MSDSDMQSTLTPGEQKEIRDFIRARLAGVEINPDTLPTWLADLVRENDRLRAETKRLQELVREACEEIGLHYTAFDAYEVKERIRNKIT